MEEEILEDLGEGRYGRAYDWRDMRYGESYGNRGGNKCEDLGGEIWEALGEEI